MIDHDRLVNENKNKLLVICQYCNSKILSPNAGTYVSQQYRLPFMTQKKDVKLEEDGEELTDFWVVDDMYTFENIGFSHTVNDIKYLTCADCEMGPIGYHILSTNKNYVALSRVKHQEN